MVATARRRSWKQRSGWGENRILFRTLRTATTNTLFPFNMLTSLIVCGLTQLYIDVLMCLNGADVCLSLMGIIRVSVLSVLLTGVAAAKLCFVVNDIVLSARIVAMVTARIAFRFMHACVVLA